MQRCRKTCTTVLHNQARMGDWQNMRPYFLPGFYSEANVPLIFLLFAFGNQKKHARILWAQETGENGGQTKHAFPSSFLAFTQKQLCLQSPCFLPHSVTRRRIRLCEIWSEAFSIGALLGPKLELGRIPRNRALPPLHFPFNRHQMKDKIMTRTVLRVGNGSIHFWERWNQVKCCQRKFCSFKWIEPKWFFMCITNKLWKFNLKIKKQNEIKRNKNTDKYQKLMDKHKGHKTGASNNKYFPTHLL